MSALHALTEFLRRELPDPSAAQLEKILSEVSRVGGNYERYRRLRSHWHNYRARRKELQKLSSCASELGLMLDALDVMSRDALRLSLTDENLEALRGHLSRLTLEAGKVFLNIQSSGRPRDLAEEMWIHEIADLFEASFQRRATIYGSGGGGGIKRGKFFEFLNLTAPAKFPRFGKFHASQLVRILKRRRSGIQK